MEVLIKSRLYLLLSASLLVVGCGHSETFVRSGTPVTWYDYRVGGVSMQEDDKSCAFASLVTIMRVHFGDTRWDEKSLFVRYFEISSREQLVAARDKGLSVMEISRIAQAADYESRRLELDIVGLAKVTQLLPAIVYLQVSARPHFAVVRGFRQGRVLLADSMRGNLDLSVSGFLREWISPPGVRAGHGVAIVIGPTETAASLSYPLRLRPNHDDTAPVVLASLARWRTAQK